jgi:conjugal transfer pilus assembly protein TraU
MSIRLGWLRRMASLLAGCILILPAWAGPTCPGKFPNPITDICWSCMLPLTLGGAKLFSMDQEDNGSNPGGSNPGGAICGCANPPRVGISIGFWEPVRIAEVVRHPYCFPTLGGLSLDLGIHAPAHGRGKGTHDSHGSSFYQAHWYTFPVLYLLEVLLESDCLEPGGLDIAYITEVDPLWNESELTFILNPDVALFANPATQAVCAADCVAATAGFPLSELYWCAGCQGSMYPLNGNVAAHIGGVQASTLIAQRMTAKMHRELLVWGASGNRGRCGYYPQPLMDKRNYKMTMLHPVPQTDKIDGKCCQPYGRTTALWGAGKSFPYRGEDFSYLIFRKRNCCASVFSPASLAP